LVRDYIKRRKLVLSKNERRKFFPDKGKYKVPNWGFADDSIALLSVASYKEFILPYHKRLAKEFSDGGHIRMHLCGDATHLFKFLYNEHIEAMYEAGKRFGHYMTE